MALWHMPFTDSTSISAAHCALPGRWAERFLVSARETAIRMSITIHETKIVLPTSKDVPKTSPILRELLDVTERGRSLGVVLFGAEQFRSAIHDRITGNCATHAYGRTNSIETGTRDYGSLPATYKNMLMRLEQGDYLIQNPVFRSLLKINFPKPIYKQFK